MPNVTSVEPRENTLTVGFDDNHVMVMRRNTGGWSGSVSGSIETFRLLHHGQEVASYNSPYQLPRNTGPLNGFVMLADGYDPDKVGQYWSAADTHIRRQVDEAGGLNKLHRLDRTMYEAFILLTYGRADLQDVKEGRSEVHQPKPQ